MDGIPNPMIQEHSTLHRRRIEDGLLRIPFSDVTVRQSGKLDLQLSGVLPTDWCLRLANGLSSARIGLLNGYARRIDGQIWICQLEAQHENNSRRAPDFLDLAMNGPLRRRTVEPPILDYQITGNAARGGALELRVVARDAVGLLAAVLHRVLTVGLVVDELLLATEGRAATHKMMIRRRDMTAPCSLERRGIAASLDRLLCSE